MLTLPKTPPAQELEDDLLDTHPVLLAVQSPAPDEVLREEILINKLGPTGPGRVHHFRNFYNSGLGKSERTLSPKALDAFSRFIEEAKFPAG